MKVYVVVGHNKTFNNISARAVFTDRETASKWVLDPEKNWFDDETRIVPLELDEDMDCKIPAESK
jgi:hypothetical protein